MLGTARRRSTTRPVEVGGFVAPGFERVASAFAENLRSRGEVGAAFAAVRGDEVLVDLWGGHADARHRRPWRADTLQPIFSGTKGVVAVCLLILIDRGELALDHPVARYWPAFAAAGKGEVTVRQVVTHTARLPGLLGRVGRDELVDDVHMGARLAAQPLLDDPRAATAYHPLTYGWLCGELVRRIDGRSVGRFVADEVAGPLDLELYLGLPPELESRVARMELSEGWGRGTVFDLARAGSDPLLAAIWANPPIWSPAGFAWNDPGVHQAQIPGAGGIATARSMARLYAGLDRLVSPGVLALGRTPLESRFDAITDEDQRFGVGFELQGAMHVFGPPSGAFGHTGAGGSVHGAWPGLGIGFSYAMNLMRDDLADDRAASLLRPLFDAACAELV